MELDFDKYCVVDGSPTTVLPAPKRRSKVPSRKSNGKLKCGNDMLSTKEGFTEISFNRYRSASCRDARSSRANREGNEALKRGSVYQSSEELKLLRKNDAILGRKKIELSRGSASAFSFGIIDTLCSLDEDSTLGEENRSSEVLLSEQSTSSFSENQLESSSWDSLNRSLYPIPGRFVPEKVSSSDKREKKSTVAPINGGKSSQERDSVVNLHKSLSAKLALPHSPAQLESDASKASSPKPWFSPVKKMFDPAVRSKSHRSPLHCYNETIYKPLLNDLSDRPHHVEDNSQCEKKDNLNSVPLSSPAHLHGLLKVGNKNGVPSFEFSVKSPEDVYVAKTWKVDNALNWVYTFHSFHHRRKSNASGWGPKDSREPTMIGQMLVSSYLCTELKSAGAYTDSMVTEFVVYDIAQSRRSTSSQDNPSCSPDISKSPLLAPHDDILSNCEQNETIAKTKMKGQSKHPRESGHFELSASQPLAKAGLHPELEIAAVAMKVPLEKRESLKFKSGDRKTNKPLPSLLDLSQLVEAKEGISGISSPGEMHVVIPAGNHSLPSSESRGPSPLLDRWRLGGGCDCGGWDMACPLDVFCNPNLRISNSCPLMDNKHPAKLFVQGRKDNIPAFNMRVIEDGKYAVDFHAQLSSLQAFSICVAILHAAEASSPVEQEKSKEMLKSDSLRVFAEEEIKNYLVDAISEEEKFKANKKMEEVLPSFVLNPPFSPIARVQTIKKKKVEIDQKSGKQLLLDHDASISLCSVDLRAESIVHKPLPLKPFIAGEGNPKYLTPNIGNAASRLKTNSFLSSCHSIHCFLKEKQKMTGDSVSPRNEKISVRQRNNAVKGTVFELLDFDYTGSNTSGNVKCTRRNSDPQSPEMLSTGELISAVGYAWSRARKPLSVLLSKTNSTSKTEVVQGGGVVQYITDEGTFHASTSANDQSCSFSLNRKANSAKLVQQNLDHLRVNQKISCHRSTSYEFFSFWRTLLARSSVIDKSFVENCLLSTGRLADLGSIYGCTSEITLANRKNEVNSVKIETKRTSNCYTDDCSPNSDNGCVPVDATSACNSLTTGNSASTSEASEPSDLSFHVAAQCDLEASATGCLENDILHEQHTEDSNCNIFTSRCDSSSPGTNLPLLSDDSRNSVKNISEGHGHQKDQGFKFVTSVSSEVEFSLSAKEKPQYALAKQEHAFAGAMAGVSVSICLHPMDTIKTVVQSCRADQKPLHDIGRSIITERGILGLYRGISSNILCSAPISAVYTFTYESVKKSLLPLLSKEYHSLVHCTAGGCASVATSFIFTPSERIKQQMQVGSHYRNCWNALIQIVQKGGLPSLYAGWGAVLCRNVPHSIIKFYTYERLKQLMLPSIQSNDQANISQTLVCGGLAGSMASLFTTPFDVVKTRLQTQIPGSGIRYSGVFNTLTEVARCEGLRGLYRGLTPRLVMYMIQGALFFASYEYFKSLFLLGGPQSHSRTCQHEQKEDCTEVLNSTMSVTG